MNQKLSIFLLIGQSNMAGRGRFGEVPSIRHSQVFMFRNGKWCRAEEPLHTDKPKIAGVGLGMSFAVEILTHMPEVAIGLLPCAVGGTSLNRWMPKADLYADAVSVTRRALTNGTLKGILWHHGEKDSGNPDYARSYGQRFQHMVINLRSELNANSVPLISGELGTFLQECDGCLHFEVVNQHLRELESILPAYGCVTSKGLTDNGDRLHFDSKSLREFGIRYARKYMALTVMYEGSEQFAEGDTVYRAQ